MRNPNERGSQHARFANIATLLKDCGLTSAELAKRIQVYPSTVSGWMTGRHKPPGAVIAYLSLLAQIKALERVA